MLKVLKECLRRLKMTDIEINRKAKKENILKIAIRNISNLKKNVLFNMHIRALFADKQRI